MSARGPTACRPTHAEPRRATRQRRDDFPYGQTHAGFSRGAGPGTRRGLLLEVRPR